MNGKVQNFFIALLILTAIYQTTTLWLISIPTNNEIATLPEFFYKNDITVYKNKENYFIPSSIITSNDSKYYLQYSYLKDDEKLNLIKNALSRTDVYELKDLDYSIFYNNFIALNFEVKISNSVLNEALSIDTKNMVDFSFDKIHLTSENDNLIISLINTTTLKVYSSTIKDLSLLNNYETRIETANNNLYYTLEIHNGLLQFIPMWDDSFISYKNVSIKNPYLSSGSLLKNNVTEKVKPLFNNSSSKIASTVDNNIVVISDAYNVAKYYPSDVLEYSNYKNYNTTSKTTLYENYMTAYEFILNDENFNNEFYLSDYTLSDGKVTFYFNCVVNNLPVLLDPIKKEKLGINSLIEVSVSNGNVVYYKTLAYNYEVTSSTSTYYKNRLINDINNIEYEKLTMGYYLEEDSEDLILYWLVLNENTTFMKSVK